MLKKRLCIILLLFLMISITTGCYTVIVHQKTISSPAEENPADPSGYLPSVSLSEPTSCVTCHNGDPGYSNVSSAHPTFGPTSLWVYYYDTDIPWWFSREQADDAAENDSTELGDTGTRRYYGRRREALNSDNASSSITPTNGMSSEGGAFIPSFPASIPSGGSTITTTITADSTKAQVVDSSQAKQESGKAESHNKKRNYGLRKDAKKK